MGFLWSQEFGRDGNFTVCFCVISVGFCVVWKGWELHRLFLCSFCGVFV